MFVGGFNWAMMVYHRSNVDDVSNKGSYAAKRIRDIKFAFVVAGAV